MEGQTLPAVDGNSSEEFYKASITLIPKTRKSHYKKRKLQTALSHEHRIKNLQENINKLSNNV